MQQHIGVEHKKLGLVAARFGGLGRLAGHDGAGFGHGRAAGRLRRLGCCWRLGACGHRRRGLHGSRGGRRFLAAAAGLGGGSGLRATARRRACGHGGGRRVQVLKIVVLFIARSGRGCTGWGVGLGGKVTSGKLAATAGRCGRQGHGARGLYLNTRQMGELTPNACHPGCKKGHLASKTAFFMGNDRTIRTHIHMEPIMHILGAPKPAIAVMDRGVGPERRKQQRRASADRAPPHGCRLAQRLRQPSFAQPSST